MSLLICSECGKEFSTNASECPNCSCPTDIVKKTYYEEACSKLKKVDDDTPLAVLDEIEYSLKPLGDYENTEELLKIIDDKKKNNLYVQSKERFAECISSDYFEQLCILKDNFKFLNNYKDSKKYYDKTCDLLEKYSEEIQETRTKDNNRIKYGIILLVVTIVAVIISVTMTIVNISFTDNSLYEKVDGLYSIDGTNLSSGVTFDKESKTATITHRFIPYSKSENNNYCIQSGYSHCDSKSIVYEFEVNKDSYGNIIITFGDKYDKYNCYFKSERKKAYITCDKNVLDNFNNAGSVRSFMRLDN